ncbi:hypothetical protein [Spirosoma endbachense]|uniref:TonB C-terminal domain-containing protein n=1 Tax=Spirosoma endbachense TaxID=2666025 RepID=A0A6P1W754_9BACT|nr:hypothetical protein [Spirosoma endbachense]QHV99849.1 hypothetical protein GJR95_34700 [Spirosoma endbachense]
MIRLTFLFGLLSVFSLKTYGQYAVYQDDKGQVMTTMDVYGSARINSTAYNKVTVLGSPFLTYPVWQEGKVQLDRSGKEINCRLAYNLVTSEILCQFAGDSTVKIITPELFTIKGIEFVRQQSSLAGINYYQYASIVHNGPTKLLKSLTKRLEPMNNSEIINNKHNKDILNSSIYRTQTNYYIQKAAARPDLISLSKKSLLDVFYEQSEKIAAKIPDKNLTLFEVVEIINYYDSLMAVARTATYPLSQNPLFNQLLHSKISYPNWVGNQGIYGRVYAGFEIDSLGKVSRVAILSPDNAGFGFAQLVQNALEKLPNLDPTYIGNYVLPVTFTFTNSYEQAGPHIPINRLSADRVGDRIVLEEFVVPYVVSKKGITGKEVWGYYR